MYAILCIIDALTAYFGIEQRIDDILNIRWNCLRQNVG